MTTIVGGVDIESTGLDFTSGHKIIEIAITRYELETQKHIDSLEMRFNPPYSKITPWIDAAIREQARGVTTVMLIPQSLDTQWYERAAECANETVILSGGRVAFVEPDVELGLVEVNINPGGSMLLIFRGYCQEAGHTISKIPLAVMKKLGGYDPANVVRKKRPRKKAA